MTKKSSKAWDAIEKESTADAEMDRILALSDGALDDELTAAGFDVPALDAKNATFIEELQRGREMHGDAADRLRRARTLLASRPARRGKLDRATLEARVEVARNDPRFSAPAAILFRNRETKDATDEELEQLLDTLEALAELVGT
jgi:hypothetical protein